MSSHANYLRHRLDPTRSGTGVPGSDEDVEDLAPQLAVVPVPDVRRSSAGARGRSGDLGSTVAWWHDGLGRLGISGLAL